MTVEIYAKVLVLLRKGWTQWRIAKECGISQSNVSNVKTGNIRFTQEQLEMVGRTVVQVGEGEPVVTVQFTDLARIWADSNPIRKVDLTEDSLWGATMVGWTVLAGLRGSIHPDLYETFNSMDYAQKVEYFNRAAEAYFQNLVFMKTAIEDAEERARWEVNQAAHLAKLADPEHQAIEAARDARRERIRLARLPIPMTNRYEKWSRILDQATGTHPYITRYLETKDPTDRAIMRYAAQIVLGDKEGIATNPRDWKKPVVLNMLDDWERDIRSMPTWIEYANSLDPQATDGIPDPALQEFVERIADDEVEPRRG